MLNYALQRVIDAVLTVLLVLTLVFLAMRVLPGDPAVAALGDQASPEQLAQFRDQMGLNASLPVQYLSFVWHMVRLDFGKSFVTNESIAALLGHALPFTLELALVAIVVGMVLGIPAGVMAATHADAYRMRWPVGFRCSVSACRNSILARCC